MRRICSDDAIDNFTDKQRKDVGAIVNIAANIGQLAGPAFRARKNSA
ncbi:MAG: hypothetical protein JWQ61_3205 [Collimonas fungivorans]|nr:hypothetical protein [Collimonas fungivorans]